MRREATPIAHQMDAWQGHERRKFFQEFQRREGDPGRAVRPRMGEGIDEVAMDIFLEALQGYGTAGCIPYQALQLVTPVGWDVGVGVQRKPLGAGTVGTCQRGPLVHAAKARANAPDPLAGPLPPRDALLHRGGHGPGELGGVISQGIIPRGHGSVATRFEVAQLAELTDDTMADFLKHVCHVGIAGQLALEKAGLAAVVGAIEIDPLEEDTMKMEIGVRRRLYLIV